MTDADQLYTEFSYAQAHVEYLVSLDGFLHLLKICQDDQNFSTYLKQKMNYLLDRGEKCKRNVNTQMNDKKVAGFYTMNDRPDSLNALKHVLQERQAKSADRQTAQEVAEMIRSIEVNDAETEARDQARITGAIARGKD